MGQRKHFWPTNALFSFPRPPKFSSVLGFGGSQFPEWREVSVCVTTPEVSLEHHGGGCGLGACGTPQTSLGCLGGQEQVKQMETR